MIPRRSSFALIAGAAVAALAGCVTLPDRVAFELRAPAEHEQHLFGGDAAHATAHAQPKREQRPFDASVFPLAHGQIIVSETGGAMSLFYSLFAVDYAPWVHAGVVAIESGEAVIYDATGTFFPIPGFAPTATVTGAVRRVSVERFARGKRIVGLYALPPSADRERLVAFAREHYRRGTPFDSYFDTDDATALYCTELVALALKAAGVAAIEPTPIRDNASLTAARDWLRLRSRSVYLAGNLIGAANEVARWSADLSPPQIDAYFALKQELHRRFDAGARLGHLFQWSGSALRLRASVRTLVDSVLASAVEPGLDAHAAPVHIDRSAARHLDAERRGAEPAVGLPRPGARSSDEAGGHASGSGVPHK